MPLLTANEIIQFLKQQCPELSISKRDLPPLTFLCGYLENIEYASNPRMIEKLMANIRVEIIASEILKNLWKLLRVLRFQRNYIKRTEIP